MGKGKKHESAAQERKNLLGINPIPDHASGSFMSKHSIASSGSDSPLHDWGILQSDMRKSGRKFGDLLRGGPSATAHVRNLSNKIINKVHSKMSSNPKSKNYLSQEDRTLVRSKKRYG